MEKIDYTCINVNINDYLSMGKKRYKIPFVTANMSIPDKTNETNIPKYYIQNVNGIAVAITGISPFPENLDTMNPKVTATPPGDALKKLIPNLKTKSDVIVLLSQFPAETTRKIVELAGVHPDLIISQRSSRLVTENQLNAIPYLIQISDSCAAIETVTLTMDSKKQITNCKTVRTKLGPHIDEDPAILAITGENITKTIEQEVNNQIIKEAIELHKLSPEEYTEMLLKKQPKKE